MRYIRFISINEKELARQLLNDYLTELSEFDDSITFDDEGVPVYKWYDPYYFTEKERYPFFLIVDGLIAGFCFIRQMSDIEFDIAEFYVIPNFRKDGNAIFFANEVIKLFKGRITFSTRLKNVRGLKFWSKVAKLYKENKFEDDEIGRNFVVFSE